MQYFSNFLIFINKGKYFFAIPHTIFIKIYFASHYSASPQFFRQPDIIYLSEILD